ncbi:MAG: site-2 protease family protein [Ruminococcus sp.]
MIRLHWHGITICLDFSFFAVAACIALLGGAQLFLEILFACLLHELGHLTAMVCFHRRVQCVICCGAGVTIQPAGDYAAYWQDQIVLLAGPLANLCFGGVLLAIRGVCSFGMLHLGLGLFNLMPFSHLDGGSILYAALSAMDLLPDRIEHIRNGISLCFSVGLTCAAFAFGIRNISFYGMVLYLLFLQFLPER